MSLRSLFAGLVILSVPQLIPARANADLTATAVPYHNYGSTGAGEFTVAFSNFGFVPSATNSAPPGRFEAFCLELEEGLDIGATYYVDFSTHAVAGGVGGGNPDPLDPRTAYLYEQFITNQLAGYVYGVGDGGIARGLSADALQHVIWFIEEEEPKLWTDGDNSLMDQFYTDTLAHAGTAIGDVRVINMYGLPNGLNLAQDLLVLTPEPSSLALAAAGLAFLLRGARHG